MSVLLIRLFKFLDLPIKVLQPNKIQTLINTFPISKISKRLAINLVWRNFYLWTVEANIIICSLNWAKIRIYHSLYKWTKGLGSIYSRPILQLISRDKSWLKMRRKSKSIIKKHRIHHLIIKKTLIILSQRSINQSLLSTNCSFNYIIWTAKIITVSFYRVQKLPKMYLSIWQ